MRGWISSVPETLLTQRRTAERTLVQTEAHLYGSSRLGVDKVNRLLLKQTVTEVFVPFSKRWVFLGVTGAPTVQPDNDSLYLCIRGKKRYEFSNHLGNVMTTLTDRRVWSTEPDPDRWVADAVSGQDYDPFGMVRPNRSASDDGYRFGFNGKEKDSEFSDESYDFGARIYDGRVGRWLSVDPLAGKYPFFSPYVSLADNPLLWIDPNGMSTDWYKNSGSGEVEWKDSDESVINDDQGEWKSLGNEILEFNGKTLTHSRESRDVNGIAKISSTSVEAVSGRPLTMVSEVEKTEPSIPLISMKITMKYTYFFNYSETNQGKPSTGPLPEGLYYIQPSGYQEVGFIDEIAGMAGRGAFPGGSHAWGEGRYWIYNESGGTSVMVNGVNRNNFSIHGGREPGSAGCIDCMGNFPIIQKSIGSTNTAKIPLVVNYEETIVKIITRITVKGPW